MWMDYWWGEGGGGQRVCWPPLKLLGGPGPPLPTPMTLLVLQTDGHYTHRANINLAHVYFVDYFCLSRVGYSVYLFHWIAINCFGDRVRF